MNADRFRGTWKVIANKMRGNYPDEHYALIEHIQDLDYRLSSSTDRHGPWEEEQVLRYNPDTCLLESLSEIGDQGRAIAFWDRRKADRAFSNCIFAIRRKPGETPKEGVEDDGLLPWERPVDENGAPDPDGVPYAGNNGTWGAEGG